MEITSHLDRIKEAFVKVKKDIVTLNNNLIVLKDEKANNNTVNQLINEITTLKERVAILEGRKNITREKIIVKEKCDEVKIVGNNDSFKVHLETCPYAKRMSPENSVKFDNVKEAIDMGYTKCSCIDNQGE